MEVVRSIRKVLIRLTDERWVHIVENHDDLAGKLHDVLEAVAEPDYILHGKQNELLAVKKRSFRSLVVVYREVSAIDGFVITAFQVSKIDQLIKSRKILWRKDS